jgi:hypothetical protein
MTLKVSDVINEEVVRNVVEDIAEENLQFREAYRDLSATDINSNTYRLVVPKDDMGEPKVVDEGEEIPLDEGENYKVDVEFEKFAFGTKLTMESLEDSMLDVKANQIEQRARKMEEDLNKRAFNNLQNNNGGTVSQDSGADGTFDFADVVAGLTQLQDNNYNPDTLIVEPDAVGDLMLDDSFTDAASDSGHEAVRSGVIGSVAGVDVLVSNSVAIDGGSFGTTNGDKNPGGILVDSDFYGYEVTRTPISTNQYTDESIQSDVVTTFTRKDWVSIYDDAAVFIEG